MLLARRSAAAVTLKDGRVLITGGSTSTGPTSETELYNPATRSWTIGDSMLASRSGHTATLLADGRVLIAGGEGSGAPGSTLEIFNPATGSDGSQDVFSAELYSASGTSANASSGQTDGFTSAANMLSARSGHSAFLLPHNAGVLMVGGSAASAELYQAWNSSFIPTSAPA